MHLGKLLGACKLDLGKHLGKLLWACKIHFIEAPVEAPGGL
jgi:hypothetical protein